jgi:two-component system, NtrC family, sensor kinase
MRTIPIYLVYLGGTLTLLLSVQLYASGALALAGAALFAGLISILTVWQLQCRIDMTNQQKTSLDQQLIQSQKLAAIGELSSGIAHEINNPLAIIGQEIEWVRHLFKESVGKGEEMGEMADSLQEIARQVDRCREITRKLLDFARKSEPLIQGVDINRVIEDMAKLVEREATSHNIALSRQYGTDLPMVYTDAPLVRQVVLNVLNNATYAIQKDGTVTIHTDASRNGYVDIAISDTGCGIPKDQVSKIFDPFFTTKPPGKGTGLGLSICHGIISKLGGRISVESDLGKGTTIRVSLPVGARQ